MADARSGIIGERERLNCRLAGDSDTGRISNEDVDWRFLRRRGVFCGILHFFANLQNLLDGGAVLWYNSN